jgi:hypothetical protein
MSEGRVDEAVSTLLQQQRVEVMRAETGSPRISIPQNDSATA